MFDFHLEKLIFVYSYSIFSTLTIQKIKDSRPICELKNETERKKRWRLRKGDEYSDQNRREKRDCHTNVEKKEIDGWRERECV